MSTGRRIVIVGGGPAGVTAALAAKQQDAAAEVLLLTDERQEPYEKPPLSKAVLTGKAMPHHARTGTRAIPLRPQLPVAVQPHVAVMSALDQ